MNKGSLEYQWRMRSEGLTDAVKAQFLKPTGNKGQVTNRDYVFAVAKLTTYQRRYEGTVFDESYTYDSIMTALSTAERVRLWFYTPCLAKRFDELSESEQSALFSNPDWVFTTKIKGVRAVLVVADGETCFYSRNFSEDDCHVPNYASHILQTACEAENIFAADVILKLAEGVDIADDLHRFGYHETATPIEQMCGLLAVEPSQALSVQRRFLETHGRQLVDVYLIAPLIYKRTRYIMQPLGDGLSVYDECLEYGRRLGFNFKSINPLITDSEIEKRVYLTSVLQYGYDGVVAQNVKGDYHTTEPRSKTSYVKIKRKHAGEGLGDSIDCFISGYGYTGDRISAVEVSIYVEGGGMRAKQLIAYVPLSKSQSAELTRHDSDGAYPSVSGSGGFISLNPEYDGAVLEVTGSGINTARLIVNPKLVRFREDKLKDECVYNKEFIESQINEYVNSEVDRLNEGKINKNKAK